MTTHRIGYGQRARQYVHESPTIQKPIIHLNGTSQDALLEGYVQAGTAIRNAINALYEAAPNARDYSPLGADAYKAANREHSARLVKLQAVLAEITELYEHVADA